MESIHAVLVSAPPAMRETYRADFVSDPELRETLAQTVTDLRMTILLNPYQPYAQFRCALISPLAGYPIERWLDRSMSLANNHYEILFNNGLLAYYQNDHEAMVQQWSKSVAIRHKYLKTILNLAAQKVPVTTVAEQLVPQSRPNFIIGLAKNSQAAHSDPKDNSTTHELVEYVQESKRFAPADRHATLAGLYHLLGNQDLAIEHWKESLKLQPMNSTFRASLVSALSGKELWQDALDQAVLGQRLFPGNNRFERQTRLIRRRMLDR
jgi:tetratricopeptide (TPR) repeat protein